MSFCRTAAIAASFFLTWPMHVLAATSYADGVDATVERQDKASELNGYLKCELSIGIVKLPTDVTFRVKILKHGSAHFYTATFDVVEVTMANGVPYGAKKVPILDGNVASNGFSTERDTKHVPMSGGGIGIMLTEDQFLRVMTVVTSGDYFVTFVPSGAKESTALVVHQGVDSKVFEQFTDCVRGMHLS